MSNQTKTLATKTSPATVSRSVNLLTEGEASRLISKLRHSTFLLNKGVTLTTEPESEPLMYNDGRKVPAFRVVITSESEMFTAMAYGFVLAISEGVNKLEGAS